MRKPQAYAVLIKSLGLIKVIPEIDLNEAEINLLDDILNSVQPRYIAFNIISSYSGLNGKPESTEEIAKRLNVSQAVISGYIGVIRTALKKEPNRKMICAIFNQANRTNHPKINTSVLDEITDVLIDQNIALQHKVDVLTAEIKQNEERLEKYKKLKGQQSLYLRI